ncbi:MAG: hypothetical protein OSB44_11595, partial [Verrucomicrobiales bacterium]|nr:hypothetical protein [Verrucomicrobiales bacterium]
EPLEPKEEGKTQPESTEEILPEPETTVVSDPEEVKDPAQVSTGEETKVISAEEKQKLLKEFSNTLTNFKKEIDAKGADFATTAIRYVQSSVGQNSGVVYEKFETPFSQENPPEEIKDNSKIIREAFGINKSTQQAIAVNTQEGLWFINLIEIIDSKQMTAEEANQIIKDNLIEKKALENIKTKLEKSKKELTKSIKDGPTFKAAAEKLGYLVNRYSYNMKSPPPSSEIDNRLLRETVLGTFGTTASEEEHATPAGQLSNVLTDDENGILIYLAEKRLKPNPAELEIKRTIKSRLRRETIDLLFQSWLTKARKEAAPSPENIFTAQQ